MQLNRRQFLGSAAAAAAFSTAPAVMTAVVQKDQGHDQRKLFKNPCSQAELNKIVPFGFSLQRQKMVFFLPSK